MSLLKALKTSYLRLESAVNTWNRDLLSDVSLLRMEGCFTDTQLVAVGQGGPSAPILAHSLVLAAVSPVLATLLLSSCDCTIIFPGVERQQLEETITRLYEGKLHEDDMHIMRSFGLMDHNNSYTDEKVDDTCDIQNQEDIECDNFGNIEPDF